LSDAQIQAVVDNEAAGEVRAHAASCARCRERVGERAGMTSAIVSSLAVSTEMPPGVALRVARALGEGSLAGATRLRGGIAEPGSWWRAATWGGGAVVAATLVAVFFVAPMVKEPATVSAAEVLAKSAGRLAERVTSGVEILEYELRLDGVPREMMPDYIDGAYHVKQLIDHDSPGRYFAAAYANGELIWGVAQDPAANRRVLTVRVDGRPYRFEFHLTGSAAVSHPEMERLHMEASITMMQASGAKHLEVVETSAGRQYRIEVPSVSAQTVNAVWDLSEAKAVIDADDYHIVELAVTGTFLKRPYSVSYRLINRTIAAQASVQASEFDLTPDPAAIVLEGDGSAIPVRDALVLALRELSKVKRAR
jgi:hypothetical protein